MIDKLNKSLTLHSYESTAVEYATYTQALHPQVYAQKFMKLLPKEATLMDVGCGPGRDAKVFQENGFQVTGIDFSPKMITLAKQNVPQAEFHVMDMEKLNFSEEMFDGAWASASFLHIPKKKTLQIFKKIYSLLKPKGIFYLSVKRGVGETLEQDKRYDNCQKFWSFFEEQELGQLLIEAKFDLLDIECSDPISAYETHPMIRIFCRKAGI